MEHASTEAYQKTNNSITIFLYFFIFFVNSYMIHINNIIHERYMILYTVIP